MEVTLKAIQVEVLTSAEEKVKKTTKVVGHRKAYAIRATITPGEFRLVTFPVNLFEPEEVLYTGNVETCLEKLVGYIKLGLEL